MDLELAEYINIMNINKNEIICHLSNTCKDKEWNKHMLHCLIPVNPEKDIIMIQYLKDIIKKNVLTGEETIPVILLTSKLLNRQILIFQMNNDSPIGILEVMEETEDPEDI